MELKSQLTIVIPIFNREKIVKATLDSVASQSLRPLNVILVDNNSSDNTLNVLEDWKRQVESSEFRVTVLCEKKPGATAARNRGLKEVTTPYTMFFDSDDLMSPSHAQRAVDAFTQNPHLDIVGWDVEVITLEGTSARLRFCDKNTLYNHIFHTTFATQRFAARTELFRKVGGWNESLLVWDDYELGVKIQLSNPTIKKLIGETTVKVVSQQESITGTDFSSKSSYWECALNATDKVLDNARCFSMKKYIEVRRIILAGFYEQEGNHADAQRLLGEVLSRSGWYRRLIMRFFYYIISHGGRGIALLAKPLLYFSK